MIWTTALHGQCGEGSLYVDTRGGITCSVCGEDDVPTMREITAAVQPDEILLYPADALADEDDVPSGPVCAYCREVPPDADYDRCHACRTWRDEEWCEARGVLAGSDEAYWRSS